MGLLDVGIALLDADIVNDVADFLFVLHPADQQDILCFHHDEILQSLQHNELVLRHIHKAAFQVVGHDLLACDNIPFPVFFKLVVKRAPGSKVRPSEIGGYHKYIVSLLHDTVVDRYVFTFGIGIFNE